LLFCGIYLAYWSTALTTLRYAIAPIAILFLGAAARMARFYQNSSTPVQVSILGGVIYCFLFAIPGIMIAKINGPQLALFSGRIDQAGYLRQTLITYAPLEFLRNHASSDERIFAVEVFSRAYAPNPVMVDSELCGAAGSCAAVDVLRELERGNYTYLILPDKPMYGAVVESLRQASSFDSGQYAVYRLGKNP
jgi:hypothetical protein